MHDPSGLVLGSDCCFPDRGSTDPEKTVLKRYFSKITGLIRIRACYLAGSGQAHFLPLGLLNKGCDLPQKGSLLPDFKITSEDLIFERFIGSQEGFLVRRQDLSAFLLERI